MSSFYPALYQAALDLLIDARERAGLTRSELAQCFNQPESFVTSYEIGERLLDPSEFIAVSREIGVDPFELLRQAELSSL